MTCVLASILRPRILRSALFAAGFVLVRPPAPIRAQEPSVGRPRADSPLLTLEDALRLARRNNPDIRAAREQARIAANDHSLGNVGFLPSLTLSAQQSRSTLRDGVSTPDRGTLDVVTALSYNLFDGFRNTLEYRRLGALETQSSIAADRVTEETLFEVAVLYFDLVRQQQQIEALRNAIQISEDRLRIAQLQLDLGSVSELEVRRAQVDRNADRAALLRQEIALAAGQARLNEFMNRDVASPYRVADTIPLDRELDVARLAELALRENRELRVAQQSLIAAQLERRAIGGEYLPSLAVQVGYVANRLADPLGQSAYRPSALYYGLSLSLNLFDGFNRERRIENLKIRQRIADLAVSRARIRIVTGLESAYATFRNRLALADLEEENAELASRNVQVALERFRLGLSISLELREVQNAHISARSRLALARFEAKRAELDLLRLGGQYLR